MTGETARTPQTFEEWLVRQKVPNGLAARFAHLSWDAALASQQAEIDRLKAELEEQKTHNWVIFQAREEARLAMENAEAELRAAREVVEQGIALADAFDRYWVHGEPIDAAVVASGAFRVTYDRLTTSEDKG